MLRIGSVFLKDVGTQTRLCAEIESKDRKTTIWFGVESCQREYLCAERSDAFVMALLPMAMRSGQDIRCETPMSRRLHYQLEKYLIPVLCSAGDLYHSISIYAPTVSTPVNHKRGVGTGFSGGVDSLYTIMNHGTGSDYPLTHLTVFNVGVFEGAAYREGFKKACHNASSFASEMGLELVGVDSNLQEALPERFLDVYSFRNLAAAMALQGLLSVYLLSSGFTAADFSIDFRQNSSYDLLTVPCSQTESMSVYSSGCQLSRSEKLAALSCWEPAGRWMHPCFHTLVGERNCGHCRKCIRDMTSLYAMGLLDQFEGVFDVPAYKKVLPLRIGFALANRDTVLDEEVISLFEKHQVPIPPAAYVYEKQFRRAMENLKKE